MSEAELLEFLFLPGFSTAAAVTEVSGRGVGLDVVQDTVRRSAGRSGSPPGPAAGTTFHLQLPITLSVVRAVLVEIAGEPYAFPHNRIDRLLRVPRDEVRIAGAPPVRRPWTARTSAWCSRAPVLDLPAGGRRRRAAGGAARATRRGQYGLIVEAFRGEQDLVVRPLDPRLGQGAERQPPRRSSTTARRC